MNDQTSRRRSVGGSSGGDGGSGGTGSTGGFGDGALGH